MIWLVLLALVGQFLPFLLPWSFGSLIAVPVVLLHSLVYVAMIVGVVLILVAKRSHLLVTILCGLLMIAPCCNFLVLMFVNMSVTRVLRMAGLRVGFMGVPDDEVERVLDPNLCTGCGYSLTGNVSGICPECGRPIAVPDAGF